MPKSAVLLLSLVPFLGVAKAKSPDGTKPGDCASLRRMQLPHTEIVIADSVPAGEFAPPSGKPISQMPPFCRIAGVLKPSTDSYIRFEVWLPASGWNGNFLGVGNGGFAGSIGYGSMAGNLKRGYATAGTDTGHQAQAEDASWAYKHPEKVKDFGYRALHETTDAAKAFLNSFYGEAPKHSYFDSCSDGGREALMEAQRFPSDFDGILAGAPANYWTHMLASGVRMLQAGYGDPTSYISSMKLPAIAAAALQACDGGDGLKDGIINDPTQCHFDPSLLLCKGVETKDCLTSPQIESLKVLYGTSDKVKPIFPGFMPGGEDEPNGWGTWIIGPAPGGSSGSFYMTNYFRYMVFDDPSWNPLTASAEQAEQAADAKTARELNAIEPDLGAFESRGGKLIMYHGWNDAAISPLNSIDYYQSVVAKMGADKAASFVRLYMIPGMQHCIGGPGANSFGQLGTTTAKGSSHGIYDALENWVEKGTAPSEIIGTKYTDDNSSKPVILTRPLCGYPLVATYKGTGDPNDADQFSCVSASSPK